MAFNLASIDWTSILNLIAIRAVEAVWAIIAIAIFLVIGVIVAKIVAWIIGKALEGVKLEAFMKKHKVHNAMLGFTLTQIITALIGVYIIFVSLGAAAQMISITFVSDVILGILAYIPSLAQGILIIVAALLIADYVTNWIKDKKSIAFSHQIGIAIEVLIAYIAVVMALPSILPNVDTTILLRLFELLLTGLVIAVCGGLALALGLGLKAPIEKAGLKNQHVFDSLFGKLSKIK